MKHIFIVNPYAGNMTFANNLREQLEAIDGLDFYLFNSRSVGNETALVKRICGFFPEETLRIYACGGSGTLKYVLDGIEDFERCEVAFYPCGTTNDYLKIFNEADRERFLDIEELITGDVVESDYLQTNHGRAINTVTFGLDTSFMEIDTIDRGSRTVGISEAYTWNLFKSLFHINRMDVKLYIDSAAFDASYMEVAFFNGICLGGSLLLGEEFQHNNGRCNYVLIPSRGIGYFASLMLSLMGGNTKRLKESTSWGSDMKRAVFMRSDMSELLVNMDGEFVKAAGEWTIEVVKGGLKFVVPRGVRLK